MIWYRIAIAAFVATCAFAWGAPSSSQAAPGRLDVPVNRSELLILPQPVEEVAIANPEIADIYVHGATRVSVIGKKIGNTSLRIFDHENNLLRDLDVYVVYDLPAIRRTLKNFFPNERIGVETVNENIALTGEVSDALVAKRAMQVLGEFVNNSKEIANRTGIGGDTQDRKVQVLNLTQVRSGQQVMLRVRIGEIQRTTLRNLGVDLSLSRTNGNAGFGFFTGDGILGETFSVLNATINPSNTTSLTATLDALEEQGLLKILAEPNLVAISGEKAEFVAGGEFPVPSWDGDEDTNRVTIEFRKFGVAVQFTPVVISANRIRLSVQPEVSEPTGTPFEVLGFPIRNLTTRKVNTTVELAPGESFMIAGLIKDSIDAKVSGVPGINEIPVMSALFRTNNFERTETELIVAVTPYLVDPITGEDIKLPTDNFQPPSFMDSIFYGALARISDNTMRVSQTPSLEGPVGFMVD